VIKATASIPSKFCRTVKTSKYSSLVVQMHAQQIHDGGGPPSKKPSNRYLRNRLTDFEEIWYDNAL